MRRFFRRPDSPGTSRTMVTGTAAFLMAVLTLVLRRLEIDIPVEDVQLAVTGLVGAAAVYLRKALKEG